jgi:hypothetical protein
VVRDIFHAMEDDTYTNLATGRSITISANFSMSVEIIARSTDTVTLSESLTVDFGEEVVTYAAGTEVILDRTRFHSSLGGVNARVAIPGRGMLSADVGRLDGTSTSTTAIFPDGRSKWLGEPAETESFFGRWDRLDGDGYAVEEACRYLRGDEE